MDGMESFSLSRYLIINVAESKVQGKTAPSKTFPDCLPISERSIFLVQHLRDALNGPAKQWRENEENSPILSRSQGNLD